VASPVIPTLRYHDAAAAIDWLAATFGFERHLVVEGEGGRIDHAELVFGDGMIMLGTAGVSPEDPVGTVRDAGTPTTSFYVIVDDVDAHAARARAAGAEILAEPEDQGYGGRRYTCRDLEGNVWSFGSYSPWKQGSNDPWAQPRE
jgi:uncharacterized glyoxalase superfamily protein PhnB